MQIYENMSKVVHMDFSLRQDFSLTSIIYIYLLYRHLIAPVYELNVIIEDEDHRLTSMSLL